MDHQQKIDFLASRTEEIRLHATMIDETLATLMGSEPEPEPEPEPKTPEPKVPTPYFDIGEATGKPGETVEIIVEAGCLEPVTGFHIGGGVGKTAVARGYGLFTAVGATLGPYLRDFLKDEGAIHDHPGQQHDHFFSKFQFVNGPHDRALPEEWWEFVVGLFSIDQSRDLSPVTIPSGTHLFTLKIRILEDTLPGEYVLTCKDEWYYTHSHQRRRDFTYTNERRGYTKIETIGGLLKVT